jgi:PPOX class probable F420-dependent enzyme
MSDQLDLVRTIGPPSSWLAVVATTRPDGSVHGSVVNAGVLDDPTTSQPAIGLVIGGATRKLDYIRRTGRASVTFRHEWQWVSVEGPVRIAGPDDQAEGIDPAAVPELLRAVFRAAGGTHDDWDEYDRVMAADRRTAVFVHPDRVITNG